MITVFHIGDIRPFGENHHPFQMDLTLVYDNDKDLRLLAKHIGEEAYPHENGWLCRLGSLLPRMDQPEKAQQLFEVILNRQLVRVKKVVFMICLDEPKRIKDNITRQSNSINKH
jgi:hypothetical protein